jgi:hypothetical protein
MKTIPKTIIFLFVLIALSVNSCAQHFTYNAVRISHVSYLRKSSGQILEQILVDLENNKVYKRINTHKNFKQIENNLELAIMSDSLKFSQLKSLSRQSAVEQDNPIYQNEYGYYKVEYLQLNNSDEVYGESFLLNKPYLDSQQDDYKVITEYYALILALMRL